MELLLKLGALESEEESARAKMDALRERHERVQPERVCDYRAWEGKADLEERLGAEAAAACAGGGERGAAKEGPTRRTGARH